MRRLTVDVLLTIAWGLAVLGAAIGLILCWTFGTLCELAYDVDRRR